MKFYIEAHLCSDKEEV